MSEAMDSTRGGGLEIALDALGETARLSVDLSLYDRAALFKTAYWATERAFLFLSVSGDGKISVEIRPKKLGSGDVEQLAREFCNALVDQQTRQIVLSETASVRDALLTKAFGAGRSHLDPERIA
jgi:His-Xaa-Ser system protein HxsD